MKINNTMRNDLKSGTIADVTLTYSDLFSLQKNIIYKS